MHSSIGSRLTRRSVCHSESTALASHQSTQRQKPPASAKGNSAKPKPTATDLTKRPSASSSRSARMPEAADETGGALGVSGERGQQLVPAHARRQRLGLQIDRD